MSGERVSIKEIFSGGIVNNGNRNNKKFSKIFRSLQWRQQYQSSEHYSITLEDGRDLKLKQILNGELKELGTGTLVWPAATVMCKYLEKVYGPNMSGKQVCDIGAGTGITGFIAAAFGAEVTLTDQDCLISFLHENVELICNDNPTIPKTLITVSEYEWDLRGFDHPVDFDLILVSDCVLPKLYPIEALIKAVSNVMVDHTIAIFSYEHRPYPEYDPRQEVERLAVKYGLKVDVIPPSEHHDVYSAEDIELWKVTKNVHNPEKALKPLKHEKNPSSSHNDMSLVMETWGDLDEISVKIAGIPVRVKQQRDLGGVGCVLWPTSVIISRFLLTTSLEAMRQKLKITSSANEKEISISLSPLAIDIGAGCGLTSMILSMLKYSIIATDKDLLLPLLQHNLSNFNSVIPTPTHEESQRPSVEVDSLDWVCVDQVFYTPGGPSEEKEALLVGENIEKMREKITRWKGRKPELLVCSDCLYSSASVEPLISVLEQLATSETVIVVANEMRTALDEFTYLIRRRPGFSVFIKEEQLTEPELEIFRSPQGRVASPPLRILLLRLTPMSEPHQI